jgi:hypothetical protein
MPFDKKGGHHLNTQKAMASDKMPPRKQSGEGGAGVGDPMPGGANEHDIGGDSSRTIITHGDDGTHSVMHHDGEESGPHMDLEEALEMIRAKHGSRMEPAAPRHGMPMHEHAMMSGM